MVFVAGWLYHLTGRWMITTRQLPPYLLEQRTLTLFLYHKIFQSYNLFNLYFIPERILFTSESVSKATGQNLRSDF